MTKKVLLFTLILIVFIALPVFYLNGIIPKKEIQLLKSGYVQKTFDKSDNKKVTYQVTSKKPRDWIDLKKISVYAKKAILLSEDWAFYEHDGLDYNQLQEAIEEGIAGKRVRGASTISQQVVKNVFLTPKKTLWRKLKESVITLYMERELSKDKIFEVYLNIAQWGDGVYGLRNASSYYFNKHPSKLNPKESAFLAMLLPSPVRYGESFRQRKLTDFGKKSVANVIEKMRLAKVLSAKEADYWLSRDLFKKSKKPVPSKKFKYSKRKLLSDGNELDAYYAQDPDAVVKENIEYDDDSLDEAFEIKDQEFSLD